MALTMALISYENVFLNENLIVSFLISDVEIGFASPKILMFYSFQNFVLWRFKFFMKHYSKTILLPIQKNSEKTYIRHITFIASSPMVHKNLLLL